LVVTRGLAEDRVGVEEGEVDAAVAVTALLRWL
jgi:hypothetical protein